VLKSAAFYKERLLIATTILLDKPPFLEPSYEKKEYGMKRIALIGECMIELNGTPFGEMRQTYGGDSLNTAVYLSRCTAGALEVSYVTAMGADALSREIVRRWEDEGLRTEGVLTDERRQPGLYLIQLNAAGERTFLYWRSESAARHLLSHPDFPRAERVLEAADMIYLSGISLAILPPADRIRLLEWLEKRAAAGVPVAFDTNYRPRLWASADEARTVFRRMFAATALALVTEEDETALWGAEEDAAVRLRRFGARDIVVKKGSDGCLCLEHGREAPLCVPCPEVKSPVDTTSAGDAFNAGFLAGFMAGKSFEEAAVQGHHLAAAVICHKGAIIPPEAMAGRVFSM
jgi:2-dehydro-3-deoxygluconokinase